VELEFVDDSWSGTYDSTPASALERINDCGVGLRSCWREYPEAVVMELRVRGGPALPLTSERNDRKDFPTQEVFERRD